MSVKPSAASVLVGQPVTYTIDVTNRTGFTLANFLVTNVFSPTSTVGAVKFTLGNGVNYAGFAFTNGSSVILDFRQFSPSGLSTGIGEATVTVTPTADGFPTNGFLTNAVVGIAPALQISSNSVATNIIVQVTGATLQSDLAVSISGLGQGILAGDTVTYNVTVANRGPDTVPNVYLTNTLPPGTALLHVAPTNQTSTFANGVLVTSLGRLTNGTSTSVKLTVQPTNSGVQTFSASVGSASLEDPNPGNNTAVANVDIGAVVLGQIIATNASAMALNRQTGLMEQTVRLVNISSSNAPSARLAVSGLTNWLYNAAGTNGTNPYVLYPTNLNSGQSVDLVLEYFIPTRVPILVDNSNYTAVGIPAVNPATPAGTNAFSVTRTVLLTNGNLLIEFPSVPGASYSILYSSDASFTNSLLAQPNIVAPADRVQWIDDGPPKTISRPASANSRFYRVIRN